jgi:hypothetical protein
MPTEWKQLGPNQFAIEMHPPLGARLFVGIALSLFASFFLYYLITGLYEYVLHATLREWISSIPGTIANLLLVLIFAVPAAVVFFKKVRVEVDQDSGMIRDVSDYRLFRRTKDYKLNTLDAIQIRYYLDSSDTQYPYNVQFLFKDAKLLTVCVEANKEDANRLAQKLAQTLHVDVKQFQED